MVSAVIFDMDGLLIDSEPLWKQAEQQVFSSVGVEVEPELAKMTAAMTTTEVTNFWYQRNPWLTKSLEQVENEVIACVESLIIEEGQALEGVHEILEFLSVRDFKIGLSTNSPFRLIPVILDKLNITDYFHAISSAQHETKGKPHPDVYITTAKKLRLPASQCIAFEDSRSGIIAAQSANMKTVAVPAKEEFSDPKFDISHLKLNKLSEFNDTHLAFLRQETI